MTTRQSLHAVAEHLMAGPQHRASGTIRLRRTDGGFGTVAQPDVRVDGSDLIVGERRVELDGATLAGLASSAGLDAGPPQGVYPVANEVAPETPLQVDAAEAAKIAEAYAVGDTALRTLSPDAQPVLWPEHFDIGIRLDDVNYGVSPGDGFIDEPYAYVGVDPVPDDEFWNAPFGAARPLADLVGADAVAAFFSEGRSRRSARR